MITGKTTDSWNDLSRVVKALWELYPNEAEKIMTYVRENSEHVELSMDTIGEVVEAYCILHNFVGLSWSKATPGKRMTLHREKLIAVLLLFYDPIRIAYASKYARRGLRKKIADVLQIKEQTASRVMNQAVDSYGIYAKFKKQVNTTHQIIKKEIWESLQIAQ